MLAAAAAFTTLALAVLPASNATPRSDSENVARYAIIVGHNGGSAGQTPLKYADDDAARLFKLLMPSTRQAWLLTTFDLESVNLYPELSQVARQPTKSALAQVLGEVNWSLNERAAEGVKTELVVFFAGHGDVDVSGQGFLMMADGRFTRADLERQVMAGSQADLNHIIIDACASYFMVGRGKDESGAVTLSPEALDILRTPNAELAAARARTGVLVSTSDASEVHESRALRGGLFSHLLRSALAGAADTNEDGRIEYAEAAAFLAGASATVRDPRARLSVHSSPPAQRPHAELSNLRRSGADRFLAIDGTREHIRILDEDGGPYADLHPAGGRVMLALNGSRLYVVQVNDEEAVLVPRRAGAYAFSSLSFEPAASPRGPDGPFKGMFSNAISVGFVEGFVASSTLPQPIVGPRFEVPWVEGHEPPARVPWLFLGGITAAASAAIAAVATAAVVANAVAFTAFDANYRETGLLDADLAVAIEVFRLSALAGALLSGAAAAGAGAMLTIGVTKGNSE